MHVQYSTTESLYMLYIYTLLAEKNKKMANFIPGSTPEVLFFWASWHEPSKAGGQMDQVFNQLSKSHPGLTFKKVEAEESDLSAKFGVEVVPTFVLLNNDGSLFEKFEGADPPEIKRIVDALALKSSSSSVEQVGRSVDHLARLVRLHPVMVFIKGSAEAPKCKFSRELCEILKAENIIFGSFDILQDENVRQGLKSFSNWPTYPQVYVNGDFVGGLDILKELRASGDLRAQMNIVDKTDAAPSAVEVPEPLVDRLRALIGNGVTLFMKGTPEAPRCGFSSKLVDILKREKVHFLHFDVLQDEEVRQGLKRFSNWPTFPQLYVKGELVGGLDIVEELASSGELTDLIKVC